MRPSSIRDFLELLRLDPEPAQTSLSASEAVQLLGLARQQLIAPWYAHRLRRVGLATQLPVAQQQELRAAGISVAMQNLSIEAGIADVMRSLSAAGIASVLLKGAAYAACGSRYPFIAHRQTGDVDMLVEPGRADEAWQLLRANGFRQVSEAPSLHPDHHHLPALASPGGYQVEIHTATTMFLTPDESWRLFGARAEVVSWRGTDVRVPANTALMWHSLVHSLGDAAEGCRLRHLLTNAALMTQPVDWGEIATLLKEKQVFQHDSRRVVPMEGVKRWLSAAAWLAGVELPATLRSNSDSGRTLQDLLLVQWQCLERIRTQPARSRYATRFGNEAATAAFRLGVQDGAHWQTWPQRWRYYMSSALLQAAYNVSIPFRQHRS
jgi:hypothetical protein